MTEKANPVFVEVTRGGVVETRHRGSAVVMKADGTVVASWGDIDEPMFLRSSTKPLQGLLLAESGAAERYNLSNKEIALGCASHFAEEKHETALKEWVSRMDFTEEDLECGPPVPSCANNTVLARRGINSACALHNNCSGQHVGFLSVAQHLGIPFKGYTDLEHPIQKMVSEILGEMTETDTSKLSVAIEGCGVPAFAFTRKQAALGYAKLANPSVLSEKRAKAAKMITSAMLAEPEYFGGNNCFDTTVTATTGNLICKEGNQGTQIAIVPEYGLGIVLKIEDGIGMAKEVAMGAILSNLGLISEESQQKLKSFLFPVTKNGAGKIVGGAKPSSVWVDSIKSVKIL